MRKKTIEEVREYFEKEGYELLEDEYINNSTPMRYKCPNGHIHTMKWNNFLHGKRCPECRGLLKHTLEKVKEVFKERGYTLLSEEYVNEKAKMKCICPNGHEYETSFSNFNRGYGCPICAGQVVTYKEVKKAFESEGFVLLSTEYINAITKLEYICPKGHKHSITWNAFKNGQRCPQCNASKGEKAIKDYLAKNNIEFIEQHRFDDCRNLLPLPFDFYIPSLNLAIEYDGEQHFKLNSCFNKTKKKLREVQKRDNIKTQYCKENNINLLRIPYWEFKNIGNILNKTFNL